MKTIWGISALSHDAAITVMRDDEILFAAHAERYSHRKNERFLNLDMLDEARQFGQPEKVIWFEKPFKKKIRQLYAGQYDELDSDNPKEYLKKLGVKLPIYYIPHHESHAAAGYFTSGFRDAAIIVVDAIGEWDTISIWEAKDNILKKKYSIKYPNSLGLLYSAFTQRIGLKPNEEEYILMGMAAYGTPRYYDDISRDFIQPTDAPIFQLTKNVHRGILNWRPDIPTSENVNIAASIQAITEKYMCSLVQWVRKNINSNNLVIMGGVALNCVTNELIARTGLYEKIWIMPNPGDAGSSLGCILAHTQSHANWIGPYLGTNIDRDIDPITVADAIIEHSIIGIANGRAEFGPRALGNRSIIADPRGATIKDKVNKIKKRQKFRPFAPIVLEHHAHRIFDMPVPNSPYMQFTAKCKFPEMYPAICHVDNTSRVQTVNSFQNPVIHRILTEFFKKTGCPLLLNTSMNIKGQPLVNDWEDALAFKEIHDIPVF